MSESETTSVSTTLRKSRTYCALNEMVMAAPVTICFNAQYVLDFLGVVETDSVSLDFKDEMSQAVLKPVGAEGYEYTYVIMPMRI